jgi:uncharacterized protein (TIGR00266 family)
LNNLEIKSNTQEQKFVDPKKIGSEGISYQTIGTTLQALSVQLDKGEHIYSEAGKMSWMTDNIEMSTHTQGFGSMISRFFSRESLFINKFTCTNGTGIVTFATDQAGKIISLQLSENSPGVIFQRGAYLCSEEGVQRSIAFIKRISAGLFGGKGFILQKVKGNGRVHLIADGEAVMYELKEGQELSVDQGNLIAYEESIDFDIQTISGPVNWFFGGEGVFVGVLRGPGKVWLQTRKFMLGSYRQYPQRGRSLPSKLIGILISLGIFGCIAFSLIFDILSGR